jgi:hypothetical protein
MLAQLLHVQIAPARQPLLRLLDRQNAVTSLKHASRLGKILTTRVLRFISWFNLSRPLVVRMRLRWLSGKARQERHSSMCSSRWQATFSWPFARHFWATEEARSRAQRLSGAAKIPRRSRVDPLRAPCASWPPPSRGGSSRSEPGSAARRPPGSRLHVLPPRLLVASVHEQVGIGHPL